LWNRFTVHKTPKHGSWLNQAEIEISLFARQCLARRRIPTLAKLRQEAGAWNARANHDRVKSTGSSLVRRPVRNSITSLPKQTALSGHRPRSMTA
jgi:hypothetical protein